MSWDHLKTSSPEQVVAGVSGKAVKVSDKTVDEVTIRKVDNGFTAQIRYKARKDKSDKGESCTEYVEPTTKVFTKAEDAISILEECFG